MSDQEASVDAREPDNGKVDQNADEPESTMLHVGNLTRNVAAGHLEEIFAKYGAVKKVDLAKDRRVGLSKGYAYVEFEEREMAEQAQLYLDGGQLDGSILKVSFILVTRRRRSPDRRSPSPRGRGRGPSFDSRPPRGVARGENWGGRGYRGNDKDRGFRRSPVRRRSPIRGRGGPRSQGYSPRRSLPRRAGQRYRRDSRDSRVARRNRSRSRSRNRSRSRSGARRRRYSSSVSRSPSRSRNRRRASPSTSGSSSSRSTRSSSSTSSSSASSRSRSRSRPRSP